MKLCIHCGTELVPDPIVRHWAHCPKHSPGRAAMAKRLAFLMNFKPLKKGRPSRAGGE